MSNTGAFTVYVDVNSGRKSSRFGQQLVSNRMGVIGAALAVTMLLAVALSGSDEGSGLAIKSAKLASAKAAPSAAALKLKHMEKTYAKKELMAEMFAAATKGMSAQAKQLARKVAARAQSLPSLAAMKTTKLDGADCAHKDTYTMIHGKFDDLLKKLTGEKDARFSENATTYTEYKSSYTAYIDSESAYREAMARKKTAEEAVTYAQGEYDKYSTAVDAGEKAYSETIAPMVTEKADLLSESEMITEVMALIQGMTSPAATKAQKMAKLAQISAKINRIVNDKKLPASLRAQALKMTKITTSLADVSASTIAEAMQILQGMKDAIEARILAIDSAVTEADQNLAADKANKLKYQIDIVTLSDTSDRENSNANTADLDRERLAGVYKVKENAYSDQADDYADDMAQFEAEITGVAQIVAVIQSLVDAC